MSANYGRDYLGRILSIFRTVAGAREQTKTLVIALGLFLALTVLVSGVLIHTLSLGAYGTLQVTRRFHVIVFLWFLISFLLALFAVKLSLMLSERIAGPVKRMERFLDRALENKDTVIVLREKDALYGVAQKINKLIESRNNIPR